MSVLSKYRTFEPGVVNIITCDNLYNPEEATDFVNIYISITNSGNKRVILRSNPSLYDFEPLKFTSSQNVQFLKFVDIYD